MTASPIEAAARAPCRLAGRPETIRFEGAPMWRSYVAQARAVFEAARDAPPPGADAAAWREMVDAVIRMDGKDATSTPSPR